ncbi:hypothetical protein CDD81_5803 [Ophiocordyceps australis]|uniref:Uncharacterized protein n=1 Tax=Ophiocordyceps australis TaxID=1399860 RepID=A0A2C5Y8E0_9HYPO|nr:hypothetical protein CDD81_5803 [Ophiocordyceps australis]
MDPQHRLLLEVVHQALDSAGLPAQHIAASRTGVYAAHFTSDYREALFRDPEAAPLYTNTGTNATSASNRISYHFDLRGPSLTVDTACSSSLVACHLACQGLLSGETDQAIVGATSLLLNPEMFLYLSNQNFLAANGQCKTFDAAGDGYGRGEGTGVVILKRVADALRDGDAIRAVIRGTGCNQDGHTRGFTLPSADAQAALIRQTYLSAGLELSHTRYVEAHGTGTQAGDRLEMQALAQTFGPHRSAHDALLVGSVKTNIGHLEACAGLASLIKCIYILETGTIAPTPSVRVPNPTIKWKEWHLAVPASPTPWPAPGLRRISTQGFGYGGTNAHVILDDAAHYLAAKRLGGNHYTRTSEPSTRQAVAEHPRLFILRAHDRDGLSRVRASLAQHLERRQGLPDSETASTTYLHDLAHTLASRRSQLQWQTFTTAATESQLLRALGQDAWPTPELRHSSTPPRLAFVMTGQGAQWAQMGLQLMAYPVYRQSVLSSDRFLRSALNCPWSAAEELAKPLAASNLAQAAYSQTLCSVLQIALVDLLEQWNIVPTRVAGHSSGEIAAAYCLGALSKQDALRVAYYRGVLSSEMQQTHADRPGAMMALGASAEVAQLYLARLTRGRAVVACINSPASVTASGDAPAIDELLALAQADGLFARKLQVDVAYHSHHMETVATAYADLLADVKPQPARPGRAMYSSVIGGAIDASQLGAANWVRNLVSPVCFSQAMSSLLLDDGKPAIDTLVEIGPHSALKGPLQQILADCRLPSISYTAMLSRGADAITTALACAGQLVVLGVPAAMHHINLEAQPRLLVDLPPYPWNHSHHYWAESRLSQEYRLRKHPRTPLLGSPCPTMGARERLWRGFVRLDEEPWIRHHEIQGAILYPAAGFLAMAIEAAAQQARDEKAAAISAFCLRDVHLDAALVVAEESSVEAILQLRPHLPAPGSSTAAWLEFTVNSSIDKGPLRQNCSGLIMLEHHADADSSMGRERALETDALCQHLEQTRQLCRQSVDVAAFYSCLDALGLCYGPSFANVTEIDRADNGHCVGAVRIPTLDSMVPPAYHDSPHVIHPATLDAIFHLGFAAVDDASLPGAMVPTTIQELVVAADMPSTPGTLLRGVSHSEAHGFRELVSDIDVLNEQGTKALVRLRGFRCAVLSGAQDSSTLAAASESRPIAFGVEWKPATALLTREELQAYIHSVVPAIMPIESESLAKSPSSLALVEMNKRGALAPLVQPIDAYIALRRHSKPNLSIVELTADSVPFSLFAALPSRQSLVQTAQYTMEASAQAASDQIKSQFGSLALEIDIQPDVQGKHDSVLVFDSGLSTAHIEALVQRASKLLLPGGAIILAGTKTDEASSWASFPLSALGLMPLLDLVGSESRGSAHFRLCLIESAPESSSVKQQESRHITLVESANPSTLAQAVAAAVAQRLHHASISTSRFAWGSDTCQLKGRQCIMLTDLEAALLKDPSPTDLAGVQSLFSHAEQILWVSGPLGPDAALITGLARTVRNEAAGIQLRTLELADVALADADACADAVCRVLDQQTTADDEFRLASATLQTSRLVEDEERNEELAQMLGRKEKTPVPTAIQEPPQAMKLCVGQVGMLDSVCFEPDALALEPLAEGEVEIDVKASGVNFRDVMVALGQIPDRKFGFEGAGIVRRTHSATTGFTTGQRVMFLSHGAHRTIHRVPAALVVSMPDTLSFVDGAALLLVHTTAWYALVKTARATPGQSVLIHAAAGGVGQALLQLARHLRLQVYATVGSSDKRKLVRERYGVPDEHIFNSRDLSFVAGIKRVTRGRGVDIVVNSLAGEALRQTWYCLAPFGTFVELGIKDILDNARLDMRPFERDATFAFFNLNHVQKERPDLICEALRETMALVRAGVLEPATPTTSFPASQAETALRRIQTGQHMGKLVLTFDARDVVPVVRPSVQISASGSYLLVGGLGGLGRSLARLLVSLGARNLCFLSRSGADSSEARSLMHELEAHHGVKLLVCQGDVCDAAAVGQAVQRCVSALGPIQGVVQCAMVLRDGLFARMTHSQWLESTRPKVQGTWNLHRHVPDPAFFLTLSSFSGVFGSRGQSNYAAAGAYQDALANLRHAQGQRAITLDLGIMRDVGVLAEKGITDQLREWEEPFGIRESEFHALLKSAIAASMQSPGRSPAQIPTGLATARSAKTAGISAPFYFDDARFSMLALTRLGSSCATTASASSPSDGDKPSVTTLLSQVQSVDQAAALVQTVLLERVAKTLQSASSEIDPSRPLHSYGVDSLVAVEMVKWMFKALHAKVTVFDVLSNVPITALCEKVASISTLVKVN